MFAYRHAVHGSPGFITSNLTGKRSDGTLIREFEASHGTVTDLDEARKRGEETSLNPLGLVEVGGPCLFVDSPLDPPSQALMGAMRHAASLHPAYKHEIDEFTRILRSTIQKSYVSGYGTRDLAGPSGLTTEAFVGATALCGRVCWLTSDTPNSPCG